MASFIDLEDSPMFHKQVSSLEQTTDELKDRCQRLFKGCQNFLASLSEAYDGDTTFADALEFFGGQEDPLSLSIGGPLISRFIGAFRELATYKDLLRLQVEHVLVDRLKQFISVDLQDVKDSRRRFDKSIYVYDQARERYASLKKSTREDVVAGVEEELQNSKSAFERTRFSLVNSLMNVESKKKYEFLESFSAIMDAHLRYFKQGYDLLSQMEPLIHQVLTYAQQSKEVTNSEQDKLARRIQEFRTQVQMDNLRAASNAEASISINSSRPVGMGSSYKDIEALMQSTTNGMVQTIKQGYLLKRSSSLRADWKRRFFVLDSRGTLYYYRTKGPKPVGPYSNQSIASGEHSNSVFGRFRARHNRTSSWSEESLGCRTVNLHTSTIKIDAEDTDLRLCFRVISPSKSYTLQAETEADRMDWVNKITGVITSLLNSHLLDQESIIPVDEKLNSNSPADAMINLPISHSRNLSSDLEKLTVGVSGLLREIPGNDHCAECSAAGPDWASLNLGILMCIECSGAHRNLGVHISKVRSITLDVKVWESTIVELFQALGNAFCNSVWEELLLADNERNDDSDCCTKSIVKPSSHDSFSKKEKYVQMKYAEKKLINANGIDAGRGSRANALWEAVRSNNLHQAYRLIAVSDNSILNTTFEEIQSADSFRLEESLGKSGHKLDPASCPRVKAGEPQNCLRGCSLLHLACHVGNAVMIELLLQFGADVNMRDFHGRTPLHHCIAKKDNNLAKYLLRRGARTLIKDWGGLTALERAMELGSITDDELFILLSENE
ncbi:ADP-ribosylation factor GTPase-activating protein AGD4-like isoform X2 [Amaranthus tricolor]|uniref:ADP-ribosylation factor GTPase-activating protein AGD4-like isoform X2 n=1 Tax=Amaranthus tricolor TaxID=29722 RepID=UPI002589F4C2|nr:ADP-ribosylation factor GTPase-activating protein AGD4-like isoform X2 [Amaranthus tricolor]